MFAIDPIFDDEEGTTQLVPGGCLYKASAMLPLGSWEYLAFSPFPQEIPWFASCSHELGLFAGEVGQHAVVEFTAPASGCVYVELEP